LAGELEKARQASLALAQEMSEEFDRKCRQIEASGLERLEAERGQFHVERETMAETFRSEIVQLQEALEKSQVCDHFYLCL
jgi:hypothetical protein